MLTIRADWDWFGSEPTAEELQAIAEGRLSAIVQEDGDSDEAIATVTAAVTTTGEPGLAVGRPGIGDIVCAVAWDRSSVSVEFDLDEDDEEDEDDPDADDEDGDGDVCLLPKSEIVACDLEIESCFGGENSSATGTITLADGRHLKIEANGSASDRGTRYKVTEEGGELQSLWWTEVKWLDEWLTNNWPSNDFDTFTGTLKFGPGQPWTETVEEVEDVEDDEDDEEDDE